MKVLQINAVYGWGSTGNMVKEVHEYLLQNGIKSFVACSQWHVEFTPGQFIIGNPVDVKMHSFMARVTGLQGYFSNRATKKLLKYIDEIKPDIVHLGNLHSNYINIIKLLDYLGKKNIATVITLHDCWFYTGKCTHYTVDNCDKWKNNCGDCPRMKKDVPSWFFDRTQKMITEKALYYNAIKRLAVISVSKWIENEARQSILKDASIMKTIHNWVDLKSFYHRTEQATRYRKVMGLQDKFIILGISSVWSDIKGLAMFYKLAKLLNKNEIIILVGELKERNLPPNIIHVPFVNTADELAVYYSMSNVFLQMSPEESFGKVVAEALACGTPVITVDSTANSELINENTGFISKVGDINDILSKINKIKKIGKERYVEACRNYAERNFNIKEQLCKYVEVYNSLLTHKI